MSLPYFFELNITATNQFTLSEETSKHCVQVLRMKTGEALHITDGNGNLYKATIYNADKKHCTVTIQEHHFTPKNNREITVAISLLKNANRFEWFLEKATELGISAIIPLISKRTEKQHFRQDRMQQIVIAAMLQSRQVWLPKLHTPTPINQHIQQSNAAIKLIAHCEECEKKSIQEIAPQSSIEILIGPEGDFTNEEIEFASSNTYQSVTLGNTRLRTETAGVVAATLLVHL
jgi:16S rRNA (uracil1498-N3)-methyltransferase